MNNRVSMKFKALSLNGDCYYESCIFLRFHLCVKLIEILLAICISLFKKMKNSKEFIFCDMKFSYAFLLVFLFNLQKRNN